MVAAITHALGQAGSAPSSAAASALTQGGATTALDGVWTAVTGGGCYPNHPTWRSCPQFR